MRFVLSNSLFAVAAVAISSFVIAVPEVRAEFDHEWTETLEKEEDPAASAVTAPRKHNNKNNNKNNKNKDRKLSFRGASAGPGSYDSYYTYSTTASTAATPPAISGNYDTESNKNMFNLKPIDNNNYAESTKFDTHLGDYLDNYYNPGSFEGEGGRAGPQSFEEDYTEVMGVSPPELAEMEPMECKRVDIEVKSFDDEPYMTIQVVAPNGSDNSVDLDNPWWEDIELEQKGLARNVKYTASNDCLDVMNDCYLLIVRDPASEGFYNGYAGIKINGQKVYEIVDGDISCGVGVQCGDQGPSAIGYTSTGNFKFTTPYAYAAMGSCDITTTRRARL